MMVLFRTALILLGLGLGVWIYKDLGHSLPGNIEWDQILFILSGASLALYLVSLLSIVLFKNFVDFSKKGRCTRCGKRVKKGELYCDFHKGEVQAEYLSRRRGEE